MDWATPYVDKAIVLGVPLMVLLLGAVAHFLECMLKALRSIENTVQHMAAQVNDERPPWTR